jgi:glycosyltransferase involved in cell wall biosynthesis
LKRILVLSKAGVGTMMSSPGIRALNIARVLGRALPEADVVLAVPGTSDLVPDAPFRVQTYTTRSLPRLILGFDTVISQGFPPTTVPAFFGRRFVMDFFTNFLIEGLEYRKEHVTPAVRQAWLNTQRVYLNMQLTMADFVICANERQRDAWLGLMSSLGLITGNVYDRDNTLEALVSVAAYGIRPEGTGDRGQGTGGNRSHPALRRIPGIGPNDTVILWNGGILKWYDPLTLIRAVARIVPRRPDVKLLFLGTRYPVAGFDPGATIDEAFALSRELGLLGTHVLFNDGWLPYDESGRFMVEAAIGVSTYYDNLETHFSYRTRLIDFLWAETPVVCTKGDVIADMIERRGLGISVPERDVDALEAALTRLLEDSGFYRACKRNLREIRDELSWERTLQPLVEFCRGERAIARAKWSRTPDLISRVARYLFARAVESALSTGSRSRGGRRPRRAAR